MRNYDILLFNSNYTSSVVTIRDMIMTVLTHGIVVSYLGYTQDYQTRWIQNSISQNKRIQSFTVAFQNITSGSEIYMQGQPLSKSNYKIQQVPHTACFILSPSGFGTYYDLCRGALWSS